MALKLKQPGIQPVCFDGYDSDYLTITGGEIGRLVAVPYVFPGSPDRAAFDVFDGYSGVPVHFRPAVSRVLPVTASTYRPLFLLDEGTTGYGVMFGTVIGGVAGQVSGTNLGPHTATGSGKVTCWDKPGMFAVTLDSVATSVNPSSSNPMPGDPLYADVTGNLTLTAAASFDNSSGSPTIVGRFVEFSTNGSMVTTPSWMVNPNIIRGLTEMVFHFRIEN